MKKLSDDGLVEDARLTSIHRERARLAGEAGRIDAELARAAARISEIRLQILAVDDDARTQAQRELSQIETRLSELRDREMAVQDRLSRSDIKAPITGTVNELMVNTIGGVVTPAEVLITIVPHDAALKVTVKLSPASIDRVDEGHLARMRFTSFNQRVTPEIIGRVAHVSPAASTDAATGKVTSWPRSRCSTASSRSFRPSGFCRACRWRSTCRPRSAPRCPIWRNP